METTAAAREPEMEYSQAAVSSESPFVSVTNEEVQNLGYNHEETDPRVVRWGFNPGLRGVHIDPRRTGLSDSLIPVGKLFPHRSFQTPQEFCTIDEYKEKEHIVVVTSEDAEREVRETLQKAGYMSCLLGLTNAAVAAVISQIVLPSLSDIRALADRFDGFVSPIANECPAADEMDYGEPREQCATCHLAWLRSDECLQYLDFAARTGVSVKLWHENEQRFEATTIHPLIEQMMEFQKTAVAGIELYIKYAAREWGNTVAEVDNNIRIKINEVEHFLRKDLHRDAPKDKDVALARKFGEAIAPALQQQNPAAADGSGLSEVALAMREQNALMGQAMQQNAQLINLLAAEKMEQPKKAQTDSKREPADGGKNAK